MASCDKDSGHNEIFPRAPKNPSETPILTTSSAKYDRVKLRGDNHLWPTTREYIVRCVLFGLFQPNPRGRCMACTGTWISTHATKACPLIIDTAHNRRNFLCCQQPYSTTWWTHHSTTTCRTATHCLQSSELDNGCIFWCPVFAGRKPRGWKMAATIAFPSESGFRDCRSVHSVRAERRS